MYCMLYQIDMEGKMTVIKHDRYHLLLLLKMSGWVLHVQG